MRRPERAIGIAARIVVARSLHHADEQRDVGGTEPAQVASEIELARGGETMHGLAALLAEEYFVDVRVEDALLAVARTR